MTPSPKKRGLGRGLDALLSGQSADTSAPDRTSVLPVSLMQAGKYQPRTRMDPASLAELAESIKVQGVIQPILVRRIGSSAAGDRYEIIAGERRFRAAQQAGLTEVPVVVRDVPDEAALAMALIENIQRENLNPLEEAQGLARLISEFGLTQETAGQAVGRSRSAAANLLRLLQLPKPLQDMLHEGRLDMGHARALLPLDKAVQITTATEVVAKKLNVRETEKLVAKAQGQGRQTPLLRVKSEKTRDVHRIEEELSDLLTAQVSIHIRRKTLRGEQGEVTIQFGSLDELNGLIDKLRQAGGGQAS